MIILNLATTVSPCAYCASGSSMQAPYEAPPSEGSAVRLIFFRVIWRIRILDKKSYVEEK